MHSAPFDTTNEVLPLRETVAPVLHAIFSLHAEGIIVAAQSSVESKRWVNAIKTSKVNPVENHIKQNPVLELATKLAAFLDFGTPNKHSLFDEIKSFNPGLRTVNSKTLLAKDTLDANPTCVFHSIIEEAAEALETFAATNTTSAIMPRVVTAKDLAASTKDAADALRRFNSDTNYALVFTTIETRVARHQPTQAASAA